MEYNRYVFKRIGVQDMEMIKELFFGVFTAEPWNDDWSDEKQLNLYLLDLVGQNNSLTYGLFEDEKLIGVSMGHTRHWFSGTEYYIDEFCIKTNQQRKGIGTFFLKQIENELREIGFAHIFLQTEIHVPAYDFYRKNGFLALKSHVSLVKTI